MASGAARSEISADRGGATGRPAAADIRAEQALVSWGVKLRRVGAALEVATWSKDLEQRLLSIALLRSLPLRVRSAGVVQIPSCASLANPRALEASV